MRLGQPFIVVGVVIAICAACDSFGGDDPGPAPPSDGGANDASPIDSGGTVDATTSDVVSADAIANDGGGPCPVGVGPSMRKVALGNNRTICVDLTEVTSAEYAAFRAPLTSTAPLAAQVPDKCSTLVIADITGTDAIPTNLPQVNVSFCSAAYFCAAQKKRLCGSATDGSAVTFTLGGAEPANEWELACANGAASNSYPWGPDPAQATVRGCNVYDGDASNDPRAVGDAPACGPPGDVGPYDMIGNVWEWINVRRDDPDAGPAYTSVRGGSFQENVGGDGCRTIHRIDGPPGDFAPGQAHVGFRCCADPF